MNTPECSTTRSKHPGLKPVLFFGAVVVALALSAPATAATYVTVHNRTTLEMQLWTQQLGTPLDRSRWRQTRTSMKPGEKAVVLELNRDTGITEGKRFFFVTTVSLGGGSVDLVQQLYGLSIDSVMWHSAGTDDWTSDRERHVQSFKAGSRYVTLCYWRVGTVGSDDLEYYFIERAPLPQLTDRSFQVLAYNVALLPPLAKSSRQMERAAEIGPAISGSDAVILSETFYNEARKVLVRGTAAQYPYRTRVVDNQMREIRRLIESQRIGPDEPVLVGGDMNIDINSSEVKDMLSILKARMPASRSGHRYTFDSKINELCTEDAREYLDYVLWSTTHARPNRSTVRTVIFKSAKKNGSRALDLSDHFAVEARYDFSPVEPPKAEQQAAGPSGSGTSRAPQQVSLLGVSSQTSDLAATH
ncbi:MAG: endonuclease/exonuclease/phosphatase family protein [Candidatus Riflebacteria bacterium]|nr:endonuclease/exonuclease/phosphatase family protein [Candidatus Riflebacteria bacterium]